MTFEKIIFIWIATIILVSFACLFIFWNIFRNKNKKGRLLFFICIDFFCSSFAAGCAIVLDTWITRNLNYVFVALNIIFLGTLLANIILLIFYNKIDNKKWPWAKISISFLFITLISIYGTINMQIVYPNEHYIQTDKIYRDIKFAVISDLHFGSCQSYDTVCDTLNKIKNENPEFLLLAGDITDEDTTKDKMVSLYYLVGNLGIPTYFVFGNHDARNESLPMQHSNHYSKDELVENLKINGIMVLEDTTIDIGDNISIIGRQDISFPDRMQLEDFYEPNINKFQIILDHSPFDLFSLKTSGADLQISGHTHAGQYFPLGHIGSILGLNFFGEFEYDNTLLVVSSGVSGGDTPFRSSQHCNYEIINLLVK